MNSVLPTRNFTIGRVAKEPTVRNSVPIGFFLTLFVLSFALASEPFGDKWARCFAQEEGKPGFNKDSAWVYCEEIAQKERDVELTQTDNLKSQKPPDQLRMIYQEKETVAHPDVKELMRKAEEERARRRPEIDTLEQRLRDLEAIKAEPPRARSYWELANPTNVLLIMSPIAGWLLFRFFPWRKLRRPVGSESLDRVEIVLLWILGCWWLIATVDSEFLWGEPRFWATVAVITIPIGLIAITRRFWF